MKDQACVKARGGAFEQCRKHIVSQRGMTPAAISLLLVHLSRARRSRVA